VSIAIDRLKQSSLTRRVQLVIAAVVVVYVVVSLANGNHGYLYHHAPLGIVLVGVVYGSVYALGAMALILIYRANKFINFALGALGSLVGVLAIGLVKVHGLNYWIALPLAVAVGAGVGALTERFMSWRFRKSSRQHRAGPAVRGIRAFRQHQGALHRLDRCLLAAVQRVVHGRRLHLPQRRGPDRGGRTGGDRLPGLVPAAHQHGHRGAGRR